MRHALANQVHFQGLSTEISSDLVRKTPGDTCFLSDQSRSGISLIGSLAKRVYSLGIILSTQYALTSNEILAFILYSNRYWEAIVGFARME